MLLAIDVGNTNTVLGIFDGEQVIEHWRIATVPDRTADEIAVVLKLFTLTRPDVAVFGQKDAQQLALVRQMSADFNLGVDVVPVPTFRDPDGLAASSRNRYLSARQRAVALTLPTALQAGQARAGGGPEAVLATARARLDNAPLTADYLALVDAQTFAPAGPDFTGEARLLVAARIGATRLIDNTPLRLGAAY